MKYKQHRGRGRGRQPNFFIRSSISPSHFECTRLRYKCWWWEHKLSHMNFKTCHLKWKRERSERLITSSFSRGLHICKIVASISNVREYDQKNKKIVSDLHKSRTNRNNRDNTETYSCFSSHIKRRNISSILQNPEN